MPDPQPLNDAERAELVAFLDGEVDEATARTIEAKINRDPQVRAEAEALRRAWNMLDFLPKPEPSPNFTQRTVTRASVLQPALRVRRWRPWLLGIGWAAAAIVAGVVGYASVPGNRDDEAEQQLVRDLPVIDHLHAYQAAGDVTFLHELDRPELFGDDPSH